MNEELEKGVCLVLGEMEKRDLGFGRTERVAAVAAAMQEAMGE